MTSNPPQNSLTLPDVTKLFALAGAKSLFSKVLANNDDSRQQVYLGGDWQALNMLPFKLSPPPKQKGSPRFYGLLNFGWLDMAGTVHPAKHAKLILYPDYPEVRFSGFLLGSSGAPADAMRDDAGRRYASRVLFLGVQDNGAVLGFLATNAPAVVHGVRAAQSAHSGSLLVPIDLPAAFNARTRLLDELSRIHRKEWIESKRLRQGRTVPCKSTNCGGYTLEAELGIETNANSEPDFLGWEVKQHAVTGLNSKSSSPITLFTPEPKAGLYCEIGVVDFVKRFGYADRRNRPDRVNFGGIFRNGIRQATTGLTLGLSGYNHAKGIIEDAAGGVALFTDNAEIAALWSFMDLLAHWRRKHAKAVYVPSRIRKLPSQQYAFGDRVRLGEGTDFMLFLSAIHDGVVYLDPGIKIECASTDRPKSKRRNQFRIASERLSCLYHSMKLESVA